MGRLYLYSRSDKAKMGAQKMITQTSKQAYFNEVLPTLGDRQIKVFNILKNSNCPLTNNEIAYKLGWSINRVTPRVFELRGRGLVESAGFKHCPITGRSAIAWRIKQVVQEAKVVPVFKPQFLEKQKQTELNPKLF